MALVQKVSTNKKRTRLLVAVFLVAGVVAALMLYIGLQDPTLRKQKYLGIFKKAINVELTPANLGLEDSDLPVFDDLGTKVFDDERLTKLELHGVFPLAPGHPGRSNPFTQVAL
jgi:hypothetical protein